MPVLSCSRLVALALLLTACPANNNAGTDTSVKETETDPDSGSSGSGNNPSTGAQTTGSTTGPDSTTTGGPSTETTTGPVSTSTTAPVDTDTSTGTSGTSGTTGPDSTSTSTSTSTDGTSTSMGSTTGEPVLGCPDGWTRARTITILNEPEKPLTNFQVSIKVTWDSDMKVDFTDLRFVDAMGTPLAHWIEDYTAPIDALVWVKVPAIAAAGTTDIEMCYGNPDAADASDGSATFHFFDGFDGNALDPAKWEATSSVEFALGALKVLKGAVYSKTSPAKFPNWLIEMRARMTMQSPNGVMPGLRISSAQISLNPGSYMVLGSQYFMWDDMSNTILSGNLTNNMGCCDASVYTVYGLAADEGNVYAFAQRKWSAVAKNIWKQPFFIGLGYEYMKNAAETEIHDMGVDWILIRKFTSVEPTTEVGPEKVL